jgi:hypothetical protein
MKRLLTLAVLLAAGWMPAGAHHSIAGIYDSSKPVTIDAVVVDFQFVNPHPYVTVESADTSGRQQPWKLEMDNRHELVAIGMTAGSLRKGDRIAVTGGPARDGSRQIYVRRLERPSDGFWYEQVGSSPRVGRGSSWK